MRRGNRCAYALNKLVRSKNISRGVKLKTYNTVVKPIVTTKKEEGMLLVRERKVLKLVGEWEESTKNWKTCMENPK